MWRPPSVLGAQRWTPRSAGTERRVARKAATIPGMSRKRMGWSEDLVHRWLQRSLRPRGLAGTFGHDAAVIARALQRPVLCGDSVIEGVHFEKGTPAERIGAKAAGRSLSDLAATAAAPRALVLNLSLPPELSQAWIQRLIRAVQARGRDFGAELVGGGLACARGPAVITVTALGELPAGKRPPGRDRARAGQVVLLSGPVGGSRLGRHLRVEPRVELGRWLWEQGATAMMDVSDGLARDLGRIARLSGVRIELESVPIHPDARRLAHPGGGSALEHALYDGEDYELLATLPAPTWRRIRLRARRKFPGLREVGRVRRGAGLFVPREEGSRERVPYDSRRGWRHGR
jgi:thiamine-monophosphate kinase